MKFKLSAIAVAVAAATLATGASAASIDFHGYARSGVGSSSKGGSIVCYGKYVGSWGTYRLGNECDTYTEMQFDANLAEKAGTAFKLHTMLAYGTQQTGDWENTSPAFRQIWAEATNVGSGPLASASLWVGKRFYKRQDVHMLDFFYNNNSGPGAGIENVDFGFAKFSFAYMRKTEQDWSGYETGRFGNYRPEVANGGLNSVTNYDFRLEGIQLGESGGAIDVFMNIVGKNNRSNAAGVKAEAKGGWGFTAQHTIGVLGGFNRAVFQYAKDASTLEGSANLNFNGKYEAFRLFDHLVFDFGDINGSAFMGYSRVKDGDKSFTMGVRPWYHFNDLYSIGAEAGYTNSRHNGGGTDRISKLTLAGQIAPGKGYWARPSLRAYYTFANWSDSLKGTNVAALGRDYGVTAQGYENATSGSTYGLQMEAWW